MKETRKLKGFGYTGDYIRWQGSLRQIVKVDKKNGYIWVRIEKPTDDAKDVQEVILMLKTKDSKKRMRA